MRKTTGFNKKIFSLLIKEAKGERSLRGFAEDCSISYVQIRKLFLCMQDNPPGKQLIKKLADNSDGGVVLEDWLFAAGLSEGQKDEKKTDPHEKQLFEKYSHLSNGQKKSLESYLDFLLK